MEVKKVVDIALSTGEVLIINSEETYRVEETIEKNMQLL